MIRDTVRVSHTHFLYVVCQYTLEILLHLWWRHLLTRLGDLLCLHTVYPSFEIKIFAYR